MRTMQGYVSPYRGLNVGDMVAIMPPGVWDRSPRPGRVVRVMKRWLAVAETHGDDYVVPDGALVRRFDRESGCIVPRVRGSVCYTIRPWTPELELQARRRVLAHQLSAAWAALEIDRGKRDFDIAQAEVALTALRQMLPPEQR